MDYLFFCDQRKLDTTLEDTIESEFWLNERHGEQEKGFRAQLRELSVLITNGYCYLLAIQAN